MNPFSDKVAVITGGASGIGQAVCEALAACGAIVVVADANATGAEHVAEAIRRTGGRAHAQHVDVANEIEMTQLVDNAVAAHQQLDYFFNIAGIGVAADARDLSSEHWRRIIDVNLWGTIYGTMAAYAVMTRQGHGHIVNMASLAGILPNPTSLPYATSKHAVVGLSLSLRAEGADLGVKVSVVCPGFVQSRVFQSATVLNVSREKMLASNPFPLLDANVAAEKILAGVAHNRATIVFPAYAKFFWWLYRFHASFINPVVLRMVRDFRRLRSSSGGN